MGKLWVRVGVSLFIGGSLQEGVRLGTGKDSGGLLVIGAIGSFVILSAAYYYWRMYSLQKKVDQERLKDDELIDNLD